MASSNIKMLNKTGNNIYSDECYTPKEALIPLFKYIDKEKTWYEATSGISNNIVECMKENGFNVVGSNCTFFNYDNRFDGIITNPPYSKKDYFIERCYDLGKPFALLLPVSSIQGQKRGKMFNKYGIELLVLNKRIDFTGKGCPHFGVAWFCWKILPEKLIFNGEK